MANIKLILVLTAMVLAGCGGGSGGSNSTSSSSSSSSATSSAASSNSSASSSSIAAGTELTGRFLDSAIEGLEYESASHSGKTDAKGEFKYAAGEEITFKLYGAKITTVKNPANGIVTPADLAGMQVNKVLTVLRLVQSLDEDGDPTNGITIPAFDYTKYPDVYDYRQLVKTCIDTSTDGTTGIVDASSTTGVDYRCKRLAKNAAGEYYYDANGELATEEFDFPDQLMLKSYRWNWMKIYLNDYDASLTGTYLGTSYVLPDNLANTYPTYPTQSNYAIGIGLLLDEGAHGWWFVKEFYPTRDIVTAENAVAHFSDTIGAVSTSTDTVLSLPGKTAEVTITRNFCTTYTKTVNLTYSFNDSGWDYSGTGVTGYTYSSGTYNINLKRPDLYSSVFFRCNQGTIKGATSYSGRSDKNYLPCANGQCKYADVNRMEFVDGSDGSRYLLFTWYNAEEKTYHHIQKYLIGTYINGQQVDAHKITTIKFN